MSAADHNSTLCKNCLTTFEGRFCPNCSQKADTHRFTVAHFGHEFFHAFTHTDKGVLLLMKDLLYRPGKVAFEYNAGKRKKYFNPITFLLIITAVQIFISKKLDIYDLIGKATQEMTQKMTNPTTEAEKEAFNKNFEDVGKQTSLVEENSKSFTLLLIPILSFFAWLLFKKSGHNYAENLVLHVFLMGGVTLLFFVTATIPILLMPSYILLWMGINFLISTGYYIFAYKQFYNQRWSSTIFKAIVMQLVMAISSQMLTWVMVRVF